MVNGNPNNWYRSIDSAVNFPDIVPIALRMIIYKFDRTMYAVINVLKINLTHYSSGVTVDWRNWNRQGLRVDAHIKRVIKLKYIAYELKTRIVRTKCR